MGDTPRFGIRFQAKDKPGPSEAGTAGSTVVGDKLGQYLEQHPEEARSIVTKAVEAARAREAARKASGLVQHRGALELTSAAPGDEHRAIAPREPVEPGVPIYRRALELAALAHHVIERADAERFFLRDQLDRKSSMIPQLIAQGLAIADMAARRQLFRHARRALTDCATIFDLLIERDSAPSDLVAAARAGTQAVLDELGELTVEPPKQW
jgi:DNA gyrase B/23S rRNA-intervening sequence protein